MRGCGKPVPCSAQLGVFFAVRARESPCSKGSGPRSLGGPSTQRHDELPKVISFGSAVHGRM